MAKVQFGEITKAEQALFLEEVEKSKAQEPQNEGTELWPEDDEDEAIQDYFKN